MKFSKKQIKKIIDIVWAQAKMGNIIYCGNIRGKFYSVELGSCSVGLEFGYLMVANEDHPAGSACKVSVSIEDEYIGAGLAYYSDFSSLENLEKHLWENALQTIPERDNELQEERQRAIQEKFRTFLNSGKTTA